MALSEKLGRKNEIQPAGGNYEPQGVHAWTLTKKGERLGTGRGTKTGRKNIGKVFVLCESQENGLGG